MSSRYRFSQSLSYEFVQFGSALVVALLLAALAIRVYHLNDSLFIAERQFRSALNAKAFFLKSSSETAELERHITIISKERLNGLEPPIFEFLVSFLYRAAGAEYLWIPRLLSTLFWLAGGVILHNIAKRVFTSKAALFALAYFLFVPSGIIISISFLPDPLMIMMFLLSVQGLISLAESYSHIKLVLAGAMSALAVLIKPLCLFAIIGVFIALVVHQNYIKKPFRWRVSLVFFTTSLIPMTIYYGYAIFIGKWLQNQADVSFLPQLLLTSNYWVNWAQLAISAVGNVSLIALALLGLSMLNNLKQRCLLWGLILGYIVFSLSFTYHIQIASHYHTQLIIIVALSIGHFAAEVLNHLQHTNERPNMYNLVPIFVALFFIATVPLKELRHTLKQQKQIENKATAQEIGRMIEHSSEVVYIAPYYGRPLEYHAGLSGTYWPRRVINWDWVRDRSNTYATLGNETFFLRIKAWFLRRLEKRELTVAERLAALEFSPEYFVITDLEEYNRHHYDLKEFLLKNCTSIMHKDEYLIYGKCLQ